MTQWVQSTRDVMGSISIYIYRKHTRARHGVSHLLYQHFEQTPSEHSNFKARSRHTKIQDSQSCTQTASQIAKKQNQTTTPPPTHKRGAKKKVNSKQCDQMWSLNSHPQKPGKIYTSPGLTSDQFSQALWVEFHLSVRYPSCKRRPGSHRQVSQQDDYFQLYLCPSPFQSAVYGWVL